MKPPKQHKPTDIWVGRHISYPYDEPRCVGCRHHKVERSSRPRNRRFFWWMWHHDDRHCCLLWTLLHRSRSPRKIPDKHLLPNHRGGGKAPKWCPLRKEPP